MSQDTKSPENLYLIGSLLLFVLLPFQNCTYSPVSVQFTSAIAGEDPGFRCETKKRRTPSMDVHSVEGVHPLDFID
ncbi:MAG: hypothetical protein KF767_06975 [Bdellovibrionaceae bacterium]|nr:hypothetical protein [Pseudobdellovibrionaceae bacterium]